MKKFLHCFITISRLLLMAYSTYMSKNNPLTMVTNALEARPYNTCPELEQGSPMINNTGGGKLVFYQMHTLFLVILTTSLGPVSMAT